METGMLRDNTDRFCERKGNNTFAILSYIALFIFNQIVVSLIYLFYIPYVSTMTGKVNRRT